MRWNWIALLVILSLVLAACAPAVETPAPAAQPTAAPTAEPTAEPTPAPQTIVDIAAADGRFTTLLAAAEAAGLVEALTGPGPLTVFAPTDEAFAKLPEGTLEALLADPETLKSILLYHVVDGKVMAADVAGLSSAPSLQGEEIAVKLDMDKVFVNEAQVLITDIEASNGVIHVIDSVILPPSLAAADQPAAADIVATAVADGRFTTLVAAVQAAGLVDTLKGEGPFTVFAPTDEAFAKLPEGTVEGLLEQPEELAKILLYHVVPGKVMAADVVGLQSAETALEQPVKISVDGDMVKINDAQVIITDIETSNGVIHVIDSVILPPGDIVATAVADGRFTTLAAALQAAGLVETLQGEGPFTVFAPTDEAFAKLPAGTLDSLLKPENKQQLTNILLYHVVSGQVFAQDVVGLESAETVLGEDVTIKVDMGKVYINDAEVIITDILTSNGVIHVIDSVILPPA
jgi:transforming growth factor-beta-induced protein